MQAQSEVQNIIMSVDIPNRTYAGKPHVQFYETLHALAGRCAGTQLPLDEEEKVSLTFAAITPSSKEYPRFTAAHYHAAMHVQAAVRGFLTRYNMRTRIDAVTQAFFDDVSRGSIDAYNDTTAGLNPDLVESEIADKLDSDSVRDGVTPAEPDIAVGH